MDQSATERPFTWPTAAADYKLLRRIGNGAFSSVWKGTCTPNAVDVAIKIMDLEQITTSFEDILQEVQTMRLCDNVHVLRCFCSFVQKDQLWLVTELMDRGSCLRVMNVARRHGFGEGMNEEWLAYILQEALQGLRYLHDNGQIHRDIKSGNILLDSRGNVRIADFGVSGWTVARGQRQETVKTFVGTPCWMAPEVMEQLEGYDHRADIWSIGITALELAKGMAPYAKYPPMRVLVLTIEEDPPSLKSSAYENDRQRTGAPFSRMYEDFVRKCLQKSPKARPSADELLKHKFLKGRTKDALLHQLLDHLPSVGAGDEPDPDEEGDSSVGSSAASFLRDAGSIGSSTNTPDFDLKSVESSSQQQQPQLCSQSSSLSIGAGNGRSGSTGDNEFSGGGSGGGLCQESNTGGCASKVSFGHSVDDNNSNSGASSSVEKEFVSGTTWVFDSSLGESGVFSGGSSGEGGGSEDGKHRDPAGHGAAGGKQGRRRRPADDEDEDLGDFLDGFDRETATIKTCSGARTRDEGGQSDRNVTQAVDLELSHPVGHAYASGHPENQYNMMPREGSLVVLDCGSIVSSLNSLGTDDVVTGLLDGGEGQRGGHPAGSQLLGAAKKSIFEFDDRDRRKSDELIAQAGGVRPGPLLHCMDDKMVSSLDGNEALERLIGSGLYPKAPASVNSPVSKTRSNPSLGRKESKCDDDDEEDLDVFLDGFEEETADMNF